MLLTKLHVGGPYELPTYVLFVDQHQTGIRRTPNLSAMPDYIK